MHRGRWRRGARGDRRPGGRRGHGGPGHRAAAVGRGRDGRRGRTARTLRRAARAAGVASWSEAGRWPLRWAGERSHDQRPRPAKPRRPRKRKFSDPGRTWAKTLERYRPGLVRFVLDELAGLYGRPTWQRRLDPTSELILTILTQNSADINAEVAFEALRARYPGDGEVQAHNPGAGWGGDGLPDGVAPDWAAIEFAPLPELVDTIRPGGLANQKAPRHPGHPAPDPRGTRRLLARIPRRHDRARAPATGSSRSTASARRPRRCCSSSRSGCR